MPIAQAILLFLGLGLGASGTTYRLPALTMRGGLQTHLGPFLAVITYHATLYLACHDAGRGPFPSHVVKVQS
ncbi:hypothetical protein V8F33_012096 [Rhypophila sp. PSN 637]